MDIERSLTLWEFSAQLLANNDNIYQNENSAQKKTGAIALFPFVSYNLVEIFVQCNYPF